MTATSLASKWDIQGTPTPHDPTADRASMAEYIRGVADGVASEKLEAKVRAKEELRTAVKDGMHKAYQHTAEVFALLRSNGLKPQGGHLRIQTIQDYQVLVRLSDKDFLSNKMSGVYTHLFERQSDWNTGKYRIKFRFSSAKGEDALLNIASDGFDLAFVEDATTGQQKGARTTQ